MSNPIYTKNVTAKNSIRYRYAIDCNKQIVDIFSDVVKNGNEYFCISCEKSLIPVKGKVRKQHFRHKVQTDCSTETYLHNLTKSIFFQTYKNCLSYNLKFEIKIDIPQICQFCKNNGPCIIDNEKEKYDLTNYFKEVYLEKKDGNYIPDILLRGEKECIYVEIAVTHKANDLKLNSGKRIIEINIKDEIDIEIIKSCLIEETEDKIKFFNFKPIPKKLDFSSKCLETDYFFILYRSGKIVVKELKLPEFEKFSRTDIFIEKINTKLTLNENF